MIYGKFLAVWLMLFFFLYEDKQVRQYKERGFIDIWSEMYLDLLNRYDEFGFFTKENFHIKLDSKGKFLIIILIVIGIITMYKNVYNMRLNLPKRSISHQTLSTIKRRNMYEEIFRKKPQ